MDFAYICLSKKDRIILASTCALPAARESPLSVHNKSSDLKDHTLWQTKGFVFPLSIQNRISTMSLTEYQAFNFAIAIEAFR